MLLFQAETQPSPLKKQRLHQEAQHPPRMPSPTEDRIDYENLEMPHGIDSPYDQQQYLSLDGLDGMDRPARLDAFIGDFMSFDASLDKELLSISPTEEDDDENPYYNPHPLG